MTKFYSLLFKNGRQGAWTTDFQQTIKSAKLFNAKIIVRTIDLLSDTYTQEILKIS